MEQLLINWLYPIIGARQAGKTEPGVLLHLRQGLLLDPSGMEGVHPGSPLSHLYCGSRNKDLSLVSGMCIVTITISMVLLPCAVSSTWTWVNQLLTLVHDWDDTGPPPIHALQDFESLGTSMSGICYDIAKQY